MDMEKTSADFGTRLDGNTSLTMNLKYLRENSIAFTVGSVCPDLLTADSDLPRICVPARLYGPMKYAPCDVELSFHLSKDGSRINPDGNLNIFHTPWGTVQVSPRDVDGISNELLAIMELSFQRHLALTFGDEVRRMVDGILVGL